MSIATKTGDDGTTGLMFGRRVSKAHPRVCAYGTVDELNAALGVARACATVPAVAQGILAVQRNLIPLMGEMAVAAEDMERYRERGRQVIGPDWVEALTAQITDLEKNHRITYEGWATPGASLASATLDVARTVCRRAERELVAQRESGIPVNAWILQYLNRLSDLCWLWARWTETLSGAMDAPEAGGKA